MSVRLSDSSTLRLLRQVATIKNNLGVNLAAMRHLARSNKAATAVMGDDLELPTQPSKRLKET